MGEDEECEGRHEWQGYIAKKMLMMKLMKKNLVRGEGRKSQATH